MLWTAASTNRVECRKARIGMEQDFKSRVPEKTSNNSGVMSTKLSLANQNNFNVLSPTK